MPPLPGMLLEFFKVVSQPPPFEFHSVPVSLTDLLFLSLFGLEENHVSEQIRMFSSILLAVPRADITSQTRYFFAKKLRLSLGILPSA